MANMQIRILEALIEKGSQVTTTEAKSSTDLRTLSCPSVLHDTSDKKSGEDRNTVLLMKALVFQSQRRIEDPVEQENQKPQNDFAQQRR